MAAAARQVFLALVRVGLLNALRNMSCVLHVLYPIKAREPVLVLLAFKTLAEGILRTLLFRNMM